MDEIPNIDAVLSKINKEYGEGTILRASKATSLVLDRIPFGVFDLDVKIGGGLPRGRITMLKGEYSTGKSTMAMRAAAESQRLDRYTFKPFYEIDSNGEVKNLDFGGNGRKPVPMRVVWLDAEHSFENSWAAKWGMDVDNTYVIQTEFAEQGIDVADLMIRSGECDLLVVDSIAALTPSVEIQESSEKWQMGVAARLINKALRKWTSGLNSGGLLSKTKCTILLINQMRVDMSGYHARLTSPGGKGLDFFQSIEIRFKRTGWIEDPETKRNIGSEIEFVINKNKTAPAARTGKFDIYFVSSNHFDKRVGETDIEGQVFRLAVYWGLVTKGGSWFSLDDHKFHGELNFRKFLKENPEVMLDLKNSILLKENSWSDNGERDVRGKEKAISKDVEKRERKSKKKISKE